MIRSRSAFFGVCLFLAGCAGFAASVVPYQSQPVTGSATSGAKDGPVGTATFNNPVNVAVDLDGSIYVCDFDNGIVRKLKSGVVTTLVKQANFSHPFGITVSPSGTLYVSTDANDLGAKDGTTGTVWVVDKVTGVATVVDRNLGRPRGIVALADDRIVLSNLTRNTISILDPVTKSNTLIAGSDGVAGFNDASGSAALFSRPYGVTVLLGGDLLVADQNNNRIRRVTMAGDVTTFVGSSTPGATDGDIATATLNGPQDVAADPTTGDVYIADTTGHRIRRVTAANVVQTIGGDGTQGYAEGVGPMSRFYGLEGFALDLPNRALIVADGNGGDGSDHNRVRRVKI